MADRPRFHLTEYGFAYGPVVVTRMFSHEGRVMLRVETDAGRRIEVYASPTGRSLRVFDDESEWLPVPSGESKEQ